MPFVPLKKYTEALDAFSKATTLSGTLYEAWNYKGYVFEDMGKQQEALDAYDKAIQMKSDFFVALNNRSLVLDAMGSHTGR